MDDVIEWIILIVMVGFALGVFAFYGEQARQLKNELKRKREREEQKSP